MQGLQVLAGFSGSCRVSRFLLDFLGVAGCPGFRRFLQGVLGLAGCPGSCRVFWVLQGVQGLAGSSGSCRVSRFFKADEVPGQAPGGGPISSCVVQTAVSDYSHTVRVPQSRAFLQAFSRPCPETIKCRELQMSTASVDWGVEMGAVFF